MPKICYYSDVKILKKPLKQRIKSLLKFFLFFLVIVGCFVCSTYLSSALTVGNLGAFVVYGGKEMKIAKSTLYAVTMGEYDTKDEAERVAMGVTVQGASGFIWEDEKYFVIGNIYKSEGDANKVIDNIKGTNYNTSIKKIIFPALTLDFSMYETKDMGVINSAFDIIDEVYDSLYDYSIKYDKGEVNHLAVSSYISDIRGDVKECIINVQKLINKVSNSDVNNIQVALVKIDEILDQAIIKAIENTSTNYSLKYAISAVVRVKFETFFQNL